MFRHFHSRSFTPAWAEAGWGDRAFAQERRGRGSGRDWGDEPRKRRGDIKFILLELLAERPQHGYELIKDLETRQGGFRRLSPGSVYPTLQLLEEGGYLTSEQLESKRVYTITESGKQFLHDRQQQMATSNAADRGSSLIQPPQELIELRRALTDLSDAVVQIAKSGNLEQATQIRERLVEVKREIYRLLADQ